MNPSFSIISPSLFSVLLKSARSGQPAIGCSTTRAHRLTLVKYHHSSEIPSPGNKWFWHAGYHYTAVRTHYISAIIIITVSRKPCIYDELVSTFMLLARWTTTSTIRIQNSNSNTPLPLRALHSINWNNPRENKKGRVLVPQRRES